MDQQTLIDVPEETGGNPVPAGRLTSKGIAPGDIVLVDKKGRRFHAEVVALNQQDSGRFELEVRPIRAHADDVRGSGGVTWRTASVREVISVWRKVRRG